MNNINAIHISQVPDNWDGQGTYSNDMIYKHLENRFTSDNCREYLSRRISRLEHKIATGKSKAYLRRWHNQRDMYRAILNFLNLHKIK